MQKSVGYCRLIIARDSGESVTVPIQKWEGGGDCCFNRTRMLLEYDAIVVQLGGLFPWARNVGTRLRNPLVLYRVLNGDPDMRGIQNQGFLNSESWGF